MQVLKPISREDKKILFTDSYYAALQRYPNLLQRVVDGRLSRLEVKKIKNKLKVGNLNFDKISSVIYAPYLVRQLERGMYCIEIDEIKGNLVAGRQNFKNFVALMALFNLLAQHSLPIHLFKYNIYFETLYILVANEFELLELFPLNIQLSGHKLVYILKNLNGLQQQWITKIRGQHSQDTHGIKNLEVIFDSKRRNVDKQIAQLMLGIDHMLRVNNRVQVFRFDFGYGGKKKQFRTLFTDLQRHKAELLKYLRDKYQKVGVYFGFIWKMHIPA
jgi:hypothetical protein